ncbi:MAG TPA: hypothetical protein VN894_20350 [Polyangiaceae bacterium]|nr:hypothetical protein [Polyangiaceae bacterium]
MGSITPPAQAPLAISAADATAVAHALADRRRPEAAERVEENTGSLASRRGCMRYHA